MNQARAANPASAFLSDPSTRQRAIVLLAIVLLVPGAIYLVRGIDYNLLVEGPGLLNEDGGPAGVDFLAFYSAAVAVWKGAAGAVYDMDALYTIQRAVIRADIVAVPFAYPPPYLIYVAPLAWLPYTAALWAWLIVLSGACLYTLWRLAPHPVTPAVALLFPGLAQSFLAGQNGLLSVA